MNEMKHAKAYKMQCETEKMENTNRKRTNKLMSVNDEKSFTVL